MIRLGFVLDVCRQIEGHLQSLQGLVNDVKDIGRAVLCSNRRIPFTAYNHAFRVNVAESEADRLIADVVGYYEPMGLKPCFMVSPSTCPSTFTDYLRKSGFELALEEDDMVFEGSHEGFVSNSEVRVAVDDGSLTNVCTDVFMKSFGFPKVFRDAFVSLLKKGGCHEGTRYYIGYFEGNPAGGCALFSFNNVGGIFAVGTIPEYRRKGIATALLKKAIGDSVSMGNTLLYLTTTKGSDAEKLYKSLGFEVAHTHYRYELHPETHS